MTAPEITVRPAGPGDAEAISALTRAVQALHVVARPDVFRPVGPDTFPPASVRALLADPARLFLVAAEGATGGTAAGGAVVSYVYAEVQRQPATPFKHAAERLYVHQMAVAEGHRRRGIGTQLLASAADAARARGLDAIALDVYAFNAAARRLYERAGFTPERVYLGRRLGVQPGGAWAGGGAGAA